MQGNVAGNLMHLMQMFVDVRLAVKVGGAIPTSVAALGAASLNGCRLSRSRLTSAVISSLFFVEILENVSVRLGQRTKRLPAFFALLAHVGMFRVQMSTNGFLVRKDLMALAAHLHDAHVTLEMGLHRV